MIAWTLFIRLSQRVVGKVLTIGLETLSCKIFLLLVELENNTYIRHRNRRMK
jgi:hypothetical protein